MNFALPVDCGGSGVGGGGGVALCPLLLMILDTCGRFEMTVGFKSCWYLDELRRTSYKHFDVNFGCLNWPC